MYIEEILEQELDETFKRFDSLKLILEDMAKPREGRYIMRDDVYLLSHAYTNIKTRALLYSAALSLLNDKKDVNDEIRQKLQEILNIKNTEFGSRLYKYKTIEGKYITFQPFF